MLSVALILTLSVATGVAIAAVGCRLIIGMMPRRDP